MCYAYADIKGKSPFLLTCILAIGARFYLAYQRANPSLPVVDAETATAIKDLAYSHLGASMFRKQPGVMDVQAVLLLANWNLFGQGMSPDNWLVSGHCGRMGYRIGLDRVAHSAPERPVLCRWRTWLGWNMCVAPPTYTNGRHDGFMSLGFGRPQVNVTPRLDELEFLRLADGPGDVMLSALAQLSVVRAATQSN
jgi:hypothetical protein